MNRQEKGRLFIIMTKLQGALELSDDLKERLKGASEDVEGKLKEEVGDLGEKLEEICRDLYELGAEHESPVRYDVNRIVKERLIRGWTQQVLANHSKLNKATVSAILKRGRGSPEKIRALAKAVGLELADLIVDE
jgi:ribosome-binding protein aMBF1 (putative translation factor)